MIAAGDMLTFALPVLASLVELDKSIIVEQMLFNVMNFSVAVLLLGMALCMYRILRGPHLADRVLAADVFAIQVVGLVLLLALRLRTTVYFDVALVVAIIGFTSSIAFSQYIYASSAWRNQK